jgi:anti-sigma factor RsiW
MNCKSFNDVLHEYLDETLDAEDQAAAREHLRRCDPCRSALLRERAFSESVGRSFDRTTAGLSLRSGMRQDVLRALESEPASSSAWSGILRRLFSLRLRPAGAMATFLGVALLILVAALHHHVSRDSAPQAVSQTGPVACVIHVPIRTQIHVFRRENNTVEDAVAYGTCVGHAGLPEISEPSTKSAPNPL